ncbi:Inner membrane protein YqiK [Comamonas sp. PE63]|uniref:Inner membrane protein YqiK n=1 Tax=Comamonas brasiliensis TaxID=1812482 RepID=A0ABS5LWW0_9BURK|nr:flotillin domain-containing protein [Comamonas sp. PE63]MBS3020983.1 Inner membrane protein YqiK [Comamonas sp. PE63]
MNNLIDLGIMTAVVLVALLAIGIIFSRLYKRSTKEIAFVRTGLGGQKVIMDGGAIVLPVFHERVLVNMNTLKLEVQRRERESLITKDRMRVDVTAAFFVRVKQTEEAVSIAAQTLGTRTMSPDELKTLVEDKFVDSLRATAATMTIQELQDMRRDFVQAVQNAVAEDLEKNGLELESVSLTSLDQTDKQFFNPNNAFDAEGLTRLTEQTEARRKQRNDVEQDTEVQVRTKNLDATRQKLTIEKDQEFATLSQQREIENTRAEQSALIATQQAERNRDAEGAKIDAERLVSQQRIEAERQVSQQRIEAEREIRAAEIEKNLVIQTREIELERHTETKRAEQRKQVEIARQDTQIAISTKSREQSDADAAANLARADAVKAEEAVNTARQVAVAEREKDIQLIEASKEAEQNAIAVKVSAAAEKEAAMDRAEALTIEARARQAAALAEAEGKRAINEALNTLSAAQIDLQVRTQLLHQLPQILAEAVRPMEKIESIRLVQVGGMPGTGGSGQSHSSASQGTFPEQVMNSALQYQIAKPIVDAVMKDAGLSNEGITGMAHSLAGMLSTPDSSALAQTAPALAGSALTPTEATAMPSQTVLPMRQI